MKNRGYLSINFMVAAKNKTQEHASDTFPKSIRIKKIIQETPQVRSYFFEYSRRAKPGQFINLWLPGFEEKPMSVAFDDGKEYMIAVAAIGGMTKELAQKKAGDFIGVRGPFGTSFNWKPKEKIAMIAGGYGAGPLYFAAKLAAKDGCKIDFFLGARAKDYLLFANRIKKLKNVRFFASTEDGSFGFKGRNIELWKQEMEKGKKYESVMTCGPELMMKAVSDTSWALKIDAQISVERYMKCGFGICGNCCVDDLGITTCQNGPVMPNSRVRKIKEFGVYHRDGIGKKHYLV